MADDPTDAEIEAGLRRAPDEAWAALWRAVAALDAEPEHVAWRGGEQVGTTVVDGVERPVLQMPYVEYSDATLAVVRALAGVGAVVPFDWPAWDGTERYRGGRGLDDAPVADAVRVVTAIVRADRFSEGTIGATLADGTLPAAIHRLRRWHDDRPEDLDRDFWDRRWSEVLREHSAAIAERPPSADVTGVAGGLAPGRALDAGCGHGSEALWLAGRGWRVTAVDFSAAALAHGRATAAALGPDVAERVEWVEADLGTWTPAADGFDLVSSLYVHVAGSVEAFVSRLATGVAPGGTLLLVGHLPIDPTTGADSPAAGQVQVTVGAALAALDPARWDVEVAEERPRAAAGTGYDAVVRARRRG